MRSLRLVFSVFAMALIAASAVSPPAEAVDEPANLIKYRQNTMKAIGGHMSAIAAVAKGEVSFADEVAGHAMAIRAMSQSLLRLFPEGSGKEAGDTRALPAIWEKWSEFEAAVKALEMEAGKMVEVGNTRDVAKIGQQLGQFGKNGCGACHETFRAPKN